MLSRELANNYLQSTIEENINDKDWGNNITLAANKKFNVPMDVVKDVCMKNNTVENINDFILYSMISVIDSKKLPMFFTDLEIKMYKNEKFDSSKTAPCKFKVVKISEDQWVGRISIEDWMALRDLQIINYNENTQRPLKRMIRGESVFYKTDINKRQVDNIFNSIMNDTYIPDTVTLNLPEDSLWEYDEETSILSIDYYTHFDIVDGMHRYLAFCRAYDEGKDFSNYYEELRITSFNEKKAGTFIWQEDQKHKLTKLASKSFNQDNVGTYVVNRLNENSILKGQITNGKSVISAVELSNAITSLFSYSKRGRKTKEDLIEKKRNDIMVYKEFESSLELVIEQDIDKMTDRWTIPYIYAFALAVKNKGTNFSEFIDKLELDTIDHLTINNRPLLIKELKRRAGV